MNLHQLKFVRETVRQNFNLTEAARALYTSQPGISKAIIELEEELGVDIFVRHGKRLKGLTAPGVQVFECIDRVMHEIDNLKRVSQDFADSDSGNITIACTHTQARYALPKVVPAFKKKFPRVHVALLQGNPRQLAEMVLREQADLAIATESVAEVEGLVAMPCYDWQHVIVVPHQHPILEEKLSLKTLAKYPIITYDTAFAGRTRIDKSFHDAGIQPDIVLAAIDSDVIKTYVELGMGVGIIAGVAYDPKRDTRLTALPAGKLFGTHTTHVAIKSRSFLRSYVYTFIEMLAPQLTRDTVQRALADAA